MERIEGQKQGEEWDPVAHAVHVGMAHRLSFALSEVDAAERRLDDEIRARAHAQRELRENVARLEDSRYRINEQTRLVALQADQLSRAREKSQQSTRAKAAFLAMISHEIRTPLNGIIGMTDFLLASDLSEEQCDYATTVARSGGALLALINDVLDFSKVEAGRMELESVEFHLHSELEDALEVVGERAQRKGLDLALRIGEGVPERVTGDSVRLRQVVINLVGNAVKFTPEGEVEVTVQWEREDDRDVLLGFAVRDTGIGIEPGRVEALFEPFVQADPGTPRRFGGTGLGLTICKQLVELMGGRIGVDSQPGKGTRFSFAVPFGKCVEHPLPSDELRTKLHGVRALCVDAQQTSGAALSEQLQRLGLQPVTVDSVDEALRRLSAPARDGAFELALVDYRTAERDPEQALRLGEALAQSATELVLLSPLVPRQQAEQLLGVPVTATVAKPVRRSLLLRALGRALRLDVTAAEIPSPPGELAGAPGGQPSLHVLIVDDNAINQKVALGLLERLGHTGELADNGLQALDALAQRSFDLVLLDCQMPEMDGYEAARRFRDREATSATPLIAMTANAMPGDRQRCLDAGMDDYLTKPLTRDALARMIENWTDSHSAQA